MHTQRVALLDLSLDHLKRDIDLLPQLKLSTAYSNYLCGGPWLSYTLWSVDNVSGDGLITQHGKSNNAGWTPDADRLPVIRELIERNFQLQKLQFARLGMILPGSTIIPHRDLLELESDLHRVHVPLVTDERCFFSERSIVYRMGLGELWFLDASEEHSVACFSDRPRIHLILDFRVDASKDEILSFPVSSVTRGIDDDCIIQRPLLTDDQRSALRQLSALLDERNHRKVVELVTHQHFRSDGGIDFVWNTLLDIAERAPDQYAGDLLRQMHRYFLVDRSSELVTD